MTEKGPYSTPTKWLAECPCGWFRKVGSKELALAYEARHVCPQALCAAQDSMMWWPAIAVCTRPRGHTQPDHYDRSHGVFWTDEKGSRR